MTHSGGKPHAVGDKGQRYEVTYSLPGDSTRRVFGWTNQIGTARAMCESVRLHPSWECPTIYDREQKEFVI